MIKNLSLEFIQLRNIQTITCEVYLNCDYLRKHLSQLDKNIAVYKNLINLYFRYHSTNLNDGGAGYIRLNKSKYVTKIQIYFVT